MKHSEMLNLNLPEDSDLINVGQLSDNFERLDSVVDIIPVKQETTTTDIDTTVYPPYWSMTNNTDSNITYVDHNFFDEEFVIEPGQNIRTDIDTPTEISISSEVTIDYVYYIPAKDAFSGGGSGGTSDYDKLSNQPKINGVKLTGDKSSADLGLASASDLSDKVSSSEKGASNGIATLDTNGKVPQSQLPTPVESKEYKLIETTSESYAKSYKLQIKNGETWSDVSESATINIPKDMVVESGSVKECTTDNVPVSGYKKGDKYIDLVIANKADAHIYINVKDLVDNKASGISYSNTTSKLTATTVQAALDEIAGLVKTNADAISDINTTLEDKVSEEEFSALEEKVDKKANKTFIESVDSDTSVVTVPDGVAEFAAISKISGRTVKSKNIIPFPYIEIGDTYFEEGGVSYTVQPDHSIIIDGKNETSSNVNTHLVDDFTLHKGVTYTISGIPSVSGLRLRFANVATSEQFFNLTSQGSLTGTPTEDITGYLYISVASGLSLNNVLVKPMLEYGDVAHEYEPYFDGLHSAPVESVVSKNDRGDIKSTVSLADITKNLPDYGIEGNYIDFEEMNYHHINKINSDGSDVEPLEIPEVINISDIIPPFAAEPNGTIEFVNEHNLDINNTVLYKKEVL